MVPAGEVRAPDRPGKEGVAGEQERVLRQVQAQAAFGVTRGQQHLQAEIAGVQHLGVGRRVVRWANLRNCNAEPVRLLRHQRELRQVRFAVHDRRTRGLFQ